MKVASDIGRGLPGENGVGTLILRRPRPLHPQDAPITPGQHYTLNCEEPVTLPDGDIVKARELSGAANLLFRRNSVTGALEATPRTGSWGGLNSVLHRN